MQLACQHWDSQSRVSPIRGNPLGLPSTINVEVVLNVAFNGEIFGVLSYQIKYTKLEHQLNANYDLN